MKYKSMSPILGTIRFFAKRLTHIYLGCMNIRPNPYMSVSDHKLANMGLSPINREYIEDH